MKHELDDLTDEQRASAIAWVSGWVVSPAEPHDYVTMASKALLTATSEISALRVERDALRAALRDACDIAQGWIDVGHDNTDYARIDAIRIGAAL